MPNKQFFLSFENFEKGLIVLYVRDLPENVSSVVDSVAAWNDGYPPLVSGQGSVGQWVHGNEATLRYLQQKRVNIGGYTEEWISFDRISFDWISFDRISFLCM